MKDFSNKKIVLCKKCMMPSSRPRITFNSSGICNGCINSMKKRKLNWKKRKDEFLRMIEKVKKKKCIYDCIVPWSGGKDSSAIAYKLKFQFGLNPLLVTFSPMIPTDVGLHNREEMLKLGFDHIFVRPNQRVARYLANRFFIERGNPKIAWDAGINVAPISTAIQLNIPMIFYAEHGESEYGGYIQSKQHQKIRDFSEFLEHQVGDDPRNWVDENVNENELYPYIYPDTVKIKKIGIKIMYFSYFFYWDIFDNYKLIKNKINFKLAPNGRTDGTFSGYDSIDDKIDNLYYYMQFIKFGFGRCVRDCARLIQLGYLDIKKAKNQIKQYDGEFPNTYLKDVLEYLSLNNKQLNSIIDKHRNSEVWFKGKNGWQLRQKLV